VILGINNDDAHPAYQHFVIHPCPGGGLKFARGLYDSVRGKIECGWNVAAGRLRMNIRVPANTTATVYVPAKDSNDVIESNKPAKSATGVKFLKMENGSAVFLVESGSYFFEVGYDGEKQ